MKNKDVCPKPRSHNGKDWGHWSCGKFKKCEKEHRGLPTASDGSQTRLDTDTGRDALPHIFHKE
jgi:hypothetical protein